MVEGGLDDVIEPIGGVDSPHVESAYNDSQLDMSTIKVQVDGKNKQHPKPPLKGIGESSQLFSFTGDGYGLQQV